MRMDGSQANLFDGLSRCFHVAGLAVLVALFSPPSQAQTQSYQTDDQRVR